MEIAARNLRLTVKNKVALGLSVILLIGIASMLFIYRGLDSVAKDVQELAHVEEPTSLAAYEMEINVNGIGLAVLKYLDQGDPFYQAWVSDDEADFKEFHGQYRRLVNTPHEKKLSAAISVGFEDFENLAHRLMRLRDRQAVLYATVAENLQAIDRNIDRRIQPAIDRRGRNGLGQIETSMDMEASIAEMGLWATAYQHVPDQDYRQRIFAKRKEFIQALARFKGLGPSQENATRAAKLRVIADQTNKLVRAILTHEDTLQEDIARFIKLRFELDNLLDDQIQALALKDLTVPRKQAYQTTEGILQVTGYLIPIYILAAVTVGLLLIRLINRPLSKLMEGTQAISRGNLNHRIELRGSDEFADLAVRFNHMIGQLQATTVSKKLLEDSERELRSAVTDLRHEIVERERAEHEQAKLEAQLRRSETMSAMGSLVAGVAHEVRNPLFAISSTLDAMNARFGDREYFQRYISVLCAEAERLGRLMKELLDYGKPPALELAPGALKDAITQAVEVSLPLAQEARVELVSRVPANLPLVQMDRMRLSQVFQNLLQNAVQHSPPGSTVSIDAEESRMDAEYYLHCAIKDSGSGFAADDLENVFDPFFSRRRGGTGLGLAIVRRIVEEHGGTVTAKNRPEGGALMTLYLPSVRTALAQASL